MNDDFHEVAQRELDAADRARRDEPSPIEERLNAELAAAYLRIGVLSARVDALDAVLPRCPTCGGKCTCPFRWTTHYRTCPLYDVPDPCPDCPEHPGKVSIEQLVATYNAVHDDALLCCDFTYRYYLRAVKP